jgi:S1-C subfamily serine protease/regulation of enolase protein 1 (concanavalin A-like superfamily)
MMHRALVLVMAGLGAACLDVQESLPLPAVAAIKDATVMVRTSSGADSGSGGSGSGFLIRVEGETGYVVTNRHVIRAPEAAPGGAMAITVVLRSGTERQQKVRGEVVASSTEPDLAIIKISGVKDMPAPLDVLKETEPVETMPVHVFGFPFGDSLALGRGSPSVVVGRGSVSSVRRDSGTRIATVLIDGALNPGNSGGPIVDAQGRLVGVAVASIRGANIGIAIPRRDLLQLLEGHPTGFSVTAIKYRPGAVDLTVRVPLFNPLENMKEIALVHGVSPGAAIEPLWPGSKTKLKVQEREAQGTITIVIGPGARKDVELRYQLAYVLKSGETVNAKPGRYLFGTLRAPTTKPAIELPINAWGDFIDPDGDCKVVLENEGVNLEVPGSLHDLNAEIAKLNAPRVVQDVEGDFVVQVRVRGELKPEGPGTRHDALPYNGAGLVLWLDGDHYIRLERGAVLRNSRVGGLLLCQKQDGDGPVVRKNAFLEEGDVYLKIERQRGRITCYYGTDGQQWAETGPFEIGWPARLSVGVTAVNSAFSPLSVRFEGFSIRSVVGDERR